MKLIFLHGLPGVGKLTVARELATITGYKLFHNHLTVDLVTSVFEFGSEPFVELREKIWLEVFAQAGKAGLGGLIFTFAPESTVRDSFIPEAQSLVEVKGGEVLFVELTCSLEELEKRLTSASRQDFGKLNSLRLFRELNAAGTFDNPRIPPSVFALDITALSADEAAKIIAKKLELGIRLSP
ncbi:MAG: AAA family ATPase [Pyrinomonadaceae bacterium]|nr:AAA family ATPase [Pyrinomonadaceae bacterium]